MLLLQLLFVCTSLLSVYSFVYRACTIPQWEALQTTLVGTYTDGTPRVIKKNALVSYDYNNTRLATTTYTTENGQTSQVKKIYDYKQKMLYTIVGDLCSKTLLDEPFRNACIPQNFSITWMRTYYGYEGPDMFWIFEYQGDWDGLHYIIQTTWNNNLVMQQTMGTEDEGYNFDLCSMPQWEAVQNTVEGTYNNGTPSVTVRNINVSYDFNNSQIATTYYEERNGYPYEITNIYKYEWNTLYAIRGINCQKISLREPFKKACVPNNFNMTWTKTFYGMTYFGPNHLFIFELQGMVNDLQYIIQTSQTGNPVFEWIYGTWNGDNVFVNSAYHNMTVGIKNQNVFEPPPNCMGLPFQTNHDAIPNRLGLVTF